VGEGFSGIVLPFTYLVEVCKSFFVYFFKYFEQFYSVPFVSLPAKLYLASLCLVQLKNTQFMGKTSEKRIINANPTKDFFISMLVRDISINDAIGDLLDNCMDGAKRLRGSGEDKRYDGLFIKIEAKPDKFTIEDNCGGIPIETAENYAFRFGRPKDMARTEWSIGQFGIGMKRALFKLGNNFKVTSYTTNDAFEMGQDINQWKDNEKWEFEFDKATFDTIEEKNTGTIIEVTELRKEIVDSFSDANFIKTLKSEIELENLYNIQRGIEVHFNGVKLKTNQLNVKISDEFSLAEWRKEFKDENENDIIKIRLEVGIGEPDSKMGGWYIFCNGRLIIAHDQTDLTGWGDGVAHFHGQYNRFRGFAYFEAIDSSKLPWDTTKTRMNRDSEIFKAVRAKMIEMMKPFRTFANKLKQENESDFEGEKVLHQKLEEAKTVNLSLEKSEYVASRTTKKFEYPEPSKPKPVGLGKGKIIFMANKDHIKKMKQFFNVDKQNDAGEKAFEYVYKTEIKDNPDYE